MTDTLDTNIIDYDAKDIYRQSEAGLMDIQKAVELYDMEYSEVTKHKKLCNLTLDNLILEIKHNIRYDWAELFIEDASNWIHRNDKLDTEKTAYSQLTKHINRIFGFVDNIQIMDIITYGYDCYGYRIEFVRSDSDYVYVLDIPVPGKCNKTNVQEFQMCKLRFGFMSGKGCIKYIVSSYDVSDLIDGMNTIQLTSQYSDHYSKIEYMENFT